MEKKKILVIDDDQIVLDSVQKILADDNYEVDTVLSGRGGLSLFDQKQYDMVLTDIRMPDMGGMRILRDIKRARPALPVLMITGYATVKSAVQAMKLGAADYLEKPFTPGELIDAVASVLHLAKILEPEEQRVIHREELTRVLERAASDNSFFTELLEHAADALDEYDLSGPEKLALLTGDISWIEQQIGPLKESQKEFLELKARYAQLSIEGFC